MALTDIAIRNAKPREKPYKMGDTLGLFLLIQPSGGKLWRFKYRLHGKEKKLSIGAYPEISLGEARAARDAARKIIAHGGDPCRERQQDKLQKVADASNTFELVAQEFFDKRKKDGNSRWAPATAAKYDYLFALLKPSLGNVPVKDITPIEVLAAVRKVEAKGTFESAQRALQTASSVFRYAVATGRLEADPTRDLRGALIVPETKHRAALLNPAEVGELLRAIDGYNGSITTKLALALAPHVFVRPGELRQAQWEELDLKNAVWTIPAAKMKMRKDHHVPLSSQAIAIIEQMRATTIRSTGYVFPSVRTTSRPMSENTLNAALRRLGYSSDEMTAHGFRATASTLLNESGKWNADAIERALAHGHENKIRGAYHRGTHWQERVEMAQWWSDHLDMLRSTPNVS